MPQTSLMRYLPVEEVGLRSLFPGAHVLRQVRYRDVANGAVKVIREVWKGQAHCGSTGACADVYVKAQDPTRTWREVYCAGVGRQIDAPIPRPFLISANDEYLPHGTALRKAVSGRPMFASESVSPYADEFRSWDEVEKCLPRWDKLPEAIVLDELVANQDRWYGNVLFSSGRLILIDHSETLGIAALDWSGRLGFGASGGFLHSAMKWSMERRRELVSGIKRVCAKLDAVDLRATAKACHLSDLTSNDQVDQAIAYLEDSRANIYPALCRQLGLPVLKVVR